MGVNWGVGGNGGEASRKEEVADPIAELEVWEGIELDMGDGNRNGTLERQAGEPGGFTWGLDQAL